MAVLGSEDSHEKGDSVLLFNLLCDCSPTSHFTCSLLLYLYCRCNQHNSERGEFNTREQHGQPPTRKERGRGKKKDQKKSKKIETFSQRVEAEGVGCAQRLLYRGYACTSVVIANNNLICSWHLSCFTLCADLNFIFVLSE